MALQGRGTGYTSVIKPVGHANGVTGQSSGGVRGDRNTRVDREGNRIQEGAAMGHTGGAGAVYDPNAAAKQAANAAATAASGAAARGAAQAAAAAAPKPPSPYGTESGPSYVEQRYMDRLTGVDPAFNYAAKRGMESLGNRYGAAGLANSGAARQGEGDFMSNLIAQSQGQLDSLAGAASGARQNKINSMFGTGMGLAGGQAGLMGAYDLQSARSNDALMEAIVQMMGGKAGVDDKSRQGGVSNIIGGLGAIF